MVEEESITGSRQNVNENESATLADDVSWRPWGHIAGFGFIFPGRLVTIPLGYLNALLFWRSWQWSSRNSCWMKWRSHSSLDPRVPCHLLYPCHLYSIHWNQVGHPAALGLLTAFRIHRGFELQVTQIPALAGSSNKEWYCAPSWDMDKKSVSRDRLNRSLVPSRPWALPLSRLVSLALPSS